MDDTNEKHVQYDESPVQDAEPQGDRLQDVLAQESQQQFEPPLQAVEHQESAQQDEVPQASSQQDVVPQESSQLDVVPLKSSQLDVMPQEPPLSDIRASKLALQEQRQEEKRRRVRETCRRLKIEEHPSKEEVVLNATSFKLDDLQAQNYIENVKCASSSISTTSDASIRVNEYVSEEDLDKIESLSSSSDASPKKLSDLDSVCSDDPLRTKVHELMLVPSLSDLSVSDVPIVKRQSSMKSVSSSAHFFASEEISEIESKYSTDSRSSAPRMEFEDDVERLDDSLEVVRESLSYPEVNEVQFEETSKMWNDIDFEGFLNEAHATFRGSSIIKENELVMATKKMISDFINMLINKVVTDDDFNDLRRSKLDVNKLQIGINDSLTEYVKVLGLNDSLNQMMSEFYHINKNQRVFVELSEEDKYMYHKRYRTALNSLNFAEERLAAVKAKYSKLTLMAQLDLNHFTHTALGTEHHFEQAVRRLLIRSDSASDQLKRLIERELRWMGEHRTEISYKRYLLIILQHDLAQLIEKIHKLDTVGDHVSMQDFISLQTKVHHFQQKIDERNIELKRMRSQYHKEQYQVHNNREKSLALKHRLYFLSDRLDTMLEKRDYLKKKLVEEKMQHLKIRAKTKELAYQGGILSMPSLMTDYDATVAFIRQKQESIAGLKETVKSLNQRISNLYSKDSTI